MVLIYIIALLIGLVLGPNTIRIIRTEERVTEMNIKWGDVVLGWFASSVPFVNMLFLLVVVIFNIAWIICEVNRPSWWTKDVFKNK